MDFNPPKLKYNCKLPTPQPLPIVWETNGKIYKFKGIFDGFSVIIDDVEDMKKLVSMGFFGKANLSRSYPQFSGTLDCVEIIRKRQFDNRKMWSENQQPTGKLNKVIVVPDSDTDDDDYFVNLMPQYEIDKSGMKEQVHLLLEEAFFLQHEIKCLNIYYLDKIIESHDAWTMFSDTDQYFQQNYVAYYYFRSKNWVVKPGIKFGGDYLLYKYGPPFYHASYVVILEILNANCKRNEHLTRRSMDIISLMGLYRLCETSGKEILICQIILPNESINYINLECIKIREILMKRWIASQERQEES